MRQVYRAAQERGFALTAADILLGREVPDEEIDAGLSPQARARRASWWPVTAKRTKT